MSFTGLLGDWLRKINASITSLSINGPTVTYNKHDGTVGTETINLDSIYAKHTGTLADNPVIRTSPSGKEANIMNAGSDLTNPDSVEVYDIGWNYDNCDGALIGFRSSANSTQPGWFRVYARNNTNSSVLTGKPTGELEWNQRSLINNGAFNKMFFSQISGSYIAPYTGVYRITLKGGGGGGGPTLTTGTNGGAGGGEGGTNIFYATLTKDVSYSYVIGAGGLGGVSAANINDLASSTSGGDTSITIGGVTYTAKGGNRGYSGTTAANAPRGGVNVFTTGIYIPGCAGSSGAKNGSFGIAPGGGQGGGVEGYNGTKGGGGCGATPTIAATNGGDGYILIEYTD